MRDFMKKVLYEAREGTKFMDKNWDSYYRELKLAGKFLICQK